MEYEKPKYDLLKTRVIIIIEGEYERYKDFATECEAKAYADGFNTGSGQYGGDCSYAGTVDDVWSSGFFDEQLINYEKAVVKDYKIVKSK